MMQRLRAACSVEPQQHILREAVGWPLATDQLGMHDWLFVRCLHGSG